MARGLIIRSLIITTIVVANIGNIQAEIEVSCKNNTSIIEKSSSHTINCKYDTADSIFGFYWQKDGNLLVRYENKQRDGATATYNISTNGSLHIYNADIRDSGVYTFIVSSSTTDHGQDSINITVVERETTTNVVTLPSSTRGTSTEGKSSDVPLDTKSSPVVIVIVVLLIVVLATCAIVGAFIWWKRQKDSKQAAKKSTGNADKPMHYNKNVEEGEKAAKTDEEKVPLNPDGNVLEQIEEAIKEKKTGEALEKLQKAYEENQISKKQFVEVYSRLWQAEVVSTEDAAEYILSKLNLNELLEAMTHLKSTTQFVVDILRYGRCQEKVPHKEYVALITNMVMTTKVLPSDFVKTEDQTAMQDIVDNIAKNVSSNEGPVEVFRDIVMQSAEFKKITKKLAVEIFVNMVNNKLISSETCVKLLHELKVSSDEIVRIILEFCGKKQISESSLADILGTMKMSFEDIMTPILNMLDSSLISIDMVVNLLRELLKAEPKLITPKQACDCLKEQLANKKITFEKYLEFRVTIFDDVLAKKYKNELKEELYPTKDKEKVRENFWKDVKAAYDTKKINDDVFIAFMLQMKILDQSTKTKFSSRLKSMLSEKRISEDTYNNWKSRYELEKSLSTK